MNKNKLILEAMDVQELHKHLEGLRSELFGLRLNAATSHVKDYSQFKKMRRAIARALTYAQRKNAALTK
jgi:ribosomal protein L29